MPVLSDPERIAVLESGMTDMRDEIRAMAGDVRAIRDVMLADAGARKGHWKTLTTIGGLIVGFTGVFSAFHSEIRRFLFGA